MPPGHVPIYFCVRLIVMNQNREHKKTLIKMAENELVGLAVKYDYLCGIISAIEKKHYDMRFELAKRYVSGDADVDQEMLRSIVHAKYLRYKRKSA